MLPSLSPALDHLHLLYPLLYAADPGLCGHISRTQPFFALAATLTLYAHDIQEYSDIARLFDVLLAMDPIFPVYLFAEVCHLVSVIQTLLFAYQYIRLFCKGKRNCLKFPMTSLKCFTPFFLNFLNHWTWKD